MSGIDKIIQQIEDNTGVFCADQISHAEEKASKIRYEAQVQADAYAVQAQESLAAKVMDIEKRGASAADLEEKKILLITKQEIISEMIDTAIVRIKNLPDEEYFALILRMITKYSLPQDGIIRFSQKDLDRMPKGFMIDANKTANGKLTLSDEPAAIDAGFILVYGGIDENCSFDAIFASESESLSDRAGKLLF